jgi:glyoxylase-like metal-dependent hydrolase (beta-lactamase superfamily II)
MADRSIPRIEEAADQIFRLETPLSGTTTVFSVYLIDDGQGVLIEPGPSAAVPAIEAGMAKLGMTDLAYIIPTHVHVDHAGGAGALAQRFPHAQVLVHPTGLKHAVDPSRLIESTRNVFGPGFEVVFGSIDPVPESQVRAPDDGEVISADGRELQIVYAPGHAPHHIAVLDSKSKGLFCGEALGLPGEGDQPFPLPAVAPPSFDQDLYLETMEKLRALSPAALFYSHGAVGRDPDRLITTAEENTRDLGEMILAALKAGESADAIGRRVGDHLSSRLGATLSEMDQAMMVGGYTLYFMKKGLA